MPVGVICLLLAQPLLHDPPYLVKARAARKGKPLSIDYVGLALISLGLACTEILLDKGQQEDWLGSNLIITLAIVGGLSLLFAIVWELDHPTPILNLRLLKERNFMLCCVIAVVIYAGLFACNVLLPQLMQTMMNYSPTQAGMILSPGGIFTMMLVPFVGMMLTRGVDPRMLIAFGLILTGAATLWMSTLTLEMAPANILWPRVVQSCGAGIMFVPLSTIAFRFLPREESGNASALYALVRNEGSSVGVALTSTMLIRTAQLHHANLVGHVNPYSDATRNTLAALAKTAHSADPTVGPALAMRMMGGIVERQAMFLSYVDQFRRFGFLIMLIVPLVFLLRKPVHDPKAGPSEPVH